MIRILADGPNEQGDVLTRLASDVFFTLGYADWQLNTQMTGRELDLVAIHRYEPREVVAEFKSGAEPAGGADINKFVGALDAQRRRADGKTVQGYFVSLAGFRASALAQEREFDDPRVVLLDGEKITEELIDGRIVVSPVRAIIAAAEVVRATTLTPEEECELIGHRIGWVWAVYFGLDEGRAVCLIHADGTPLSLATATEIAATGSRNPLSGLRLLNREGRSAAAGAIRKTYLSFLASEFGGLTLEGMPIDETAGSRRFTLEELYVPLKLVDANGAPAPLSGIDVGEAIERHRHLAVLGAPGSGKTTLLKRVAVAYADPARLAMSADGLAGHDWLPVVVKCRQLGSRANSPMLSVIGEQADLAEMPEHRDEFVDLVTRELRQGTLLLLIDGLDEIADPGDRARFVAQLRTFIGVYPTCRLIVTSRDAGFRSVAASVGAICHPVRVAELSDEGIRSLVLAWRAEVVGRSARVRATAESLAAAIIGSDRLRGLAVNPMLLTTLLLVQRWIGELPRRRSVLYDKAIEVLLTTWNVEGHEPLDSGEAIPQLAYTAFAMMTAGKTSVTQDELAALLTAARHDLPETLGYTRMSVHEFVDRVEDRSSLMARSGHELVDGKVVPIYEFKHLTFQEYLAAVAVTQGWLDPGLRDRSIEAILEPHLAGARWQEVVVLSAVLGGRRAFGIVTRLIDEIRAGMGDADLTSAEAAPKPTLERADVLCLNLLGCLRDEASLAPELARLAIEVWVQASHSWLIVGDPLGFALHGGRYDKLARDIAFAHLDPADPHFYAFAAVLGGLGFLDRNDEGDDLTTDDWIAARLSRDDDGSQLLALATLRTAASYPLRVPCPRSVRMVVESLLSGPLRQDARTLLGVRALSSLSKALPPMPVPMINELQVRLVQLWMRTEELMPARAVLWALTSTPLVGSWDLDEVEKARYLAFAERQADAAGRNREERRHGSLLIRRYLQPHETWPALVREIAGAIGPDLDGDDSFLLDLLGSLGDEGQAQLRRLRPGVYDDPWPEMPEPPVPGLGDGA